MTLHDRRDGNWMRRGAGLLLLLACLQLVSCAAPGTTGANAPRPDLVTASDEPEVRTRARIRLERRRHVARDRPAQLTNTPSASGAPANSRS